MKTKKYLGIWMDHSIAYMMELSNDMIVTNTVESQIELQDHEENVYKDEKHSLKKEKKYLLAYYKTLSDFMKDYDEVVLFGPTDAKNELLNLVKEDHHFDEIKIEIKSADKMTENQQQAFVKEYFV